MHSDLDRLREDLATVRSAAGLDPAWNQHAIRIHVLLAAAGAAAALWAALSHGLPKVAGMAAFVVPVADWWWQARGRPNRSAMDDREWRQAMRVFWYALPFIGLACWSRFVGLQLVMTAGLICFMLGLILFGSAVSERRWRPLLGWAMALMIGGLVTPLRAESMVLIVALAICLGAVTSALWIAVDRGDTNVG